MNKIIALLAFCFLLTASRSVWAEQSRDRIETSVEKGGTLIVVHVYKNNFPVLTYGYFTEKNLHSNGTPFSTALIMEETRDVFMRFDERNILMSFSVIKYSRGERFKVYFCDDSEDSRRRCGRMQEFWNGIYAQYEIERRVRRALPE